jgi:hypothetical protein
LFLLSRVFVKRVCFVASVRQACWGGWFVCVQRLSVSSYWMHLYTEFAVSFIRLPISAW